MASRGQAPAPLPRPADNSQQLQQQSSAPHIVRDVVRAAVVQNGRALGYAAAELRADRDFVLAAVAQNGYALEHAAAELRADPALCELRDLNPRVSVR